LIAPESTVEPEVLGDLERLAGQVGFIHHAVSLDYHAVHRTDVMRINHEQSSTATSGSATSHDFSFPFTVGDRRHPLASAASTEEALRNA